MFYLKNSLIQAIFLIVFFYSFQSQSSNITYIGDSQSAVPYGLFNNLRGAIPNDQHSFLNSRAVCGANMEDYSSQAKRGRCNYPGVTHLSGSNFVESRGSTVLINQLMTNETDTVIVQLGDNHLGSSEASIRASAQRLARQILSSGNSCIWIGPARANGPSCLERDRQKRQASEAISRALAELEVNGRKCHFINSYTLTNENLSTSGDCLHYTSSGYRQWSQAISGRVLAELNRQSQNRPEGESSSSEAIPLQ